MLSDVADTAPAPSRVTSEEIRYLNTFLGMKALVVSLGMIYAALRLGGSQEFQENMRIFGLLLAIALVQFLASRIPAGRLTLLAFGFVVEPVIVTVAIFLINDRSGNTFLVAGCPHFALYYLTVTQAAILFRRRLVALSGAAAVLALFGLLAWLSWLEAAPHDHGALRNLTLFPESLNHHGNFRSFITAHMLAVSLQAGVLLVLVHIGKRLFVAWRRAEHARTNLARYFSPQMVEGLMQEESPTGGDRRQNVAVLFVDMRGFTGMAEGMEPEQVLDLLREFHRRCETEIFRCNGFMEKFVGDALLVAFGVPEPSDRDALKAFDCARGILDSMAAWNDERHSAGFESIEVGIGLHYGPAVLGDIGSQRSVTFAVIGDTVNVTSRLQELTKRLATPLAASEEFVARWSTESGRPADRQPYLHAAGAFEIEGRKKRINAWTYRPFRLPVPAAPLSGLQAAASEQARR